MIARIPPLGRGPGGATRRALAAARRRRSTSATAGMREPLPLPCAERRPHTRGRGLRRRRPRGGARRGARGLAVGLSAPGEDAEPENVLAFGAGSRSRSSCRSRPRPTSRGRAGPPRSLAVRAAARGACGTRCSRSRRWSSRERAVGLAPVRPQRPAADRRHRARGERRHRQDFHDRGARDALRRRGPPARTSCCS